MHLSLPVAFQNPAFVALLALEPVGYFLSLWLKKYHSFCGVAPIVHLSTPINLQHQIAHDITIVIWSESVLQDKHGRLDKENLLIEDSSSSLGINFVRKIYNLIPSCRELSMQLIARREMINSITLEVPRLHLVQVHFSNDLQLELLEAHLLLQIVVQ